MLYMRFVLPLALPYPSQVYMANSSMQTGRCTQVQLACSVFHNIMSGASEAVVYAPRALQNAGRIGQCDLLACVFEREGRKKSNGDEPDLGDEEKEEREREGQRCKSKL